MVPLSQPELDVIVEDAYTQKMVGLFYNAQKLKQSSRPTSKRKKINPSKPSKFLSGFANPYLEENSAYFNRRASGGKFKSSKQSMGKDFHAVDYGLTEAEK